MFFFTLLLSHCDWIDECHGHVSDGRRYKLNYSNIAQCFSPCFLYFLANDILQSGQICGTECMYTTDPNIRARYKEIPVISTSTIRSPNFYMIDVTGECYHATESKLNTVEVNV